MAATTIPWPDGRTTGRVAMGARVAPTLAARIVHAVGGRLSVELGIFPEHGAADVERWFLASTLFGNRISAPVAMRTFQALESAGVRRIGDVETRTAAELIGLLDAGGYARYDSRMASRLRDLANAVRRCYGGEVAEIGRRFDEPRALEAALDELPGWGPATIGVFLREMRGVWPGARPSLDRRAREAARHVGLLGGSESDSDGIGDGDGDRDGDCDREDDAIGRLTLVARLGHCGETDLEEALVRLSRAHRSIASCPGGRDCVVLQRASPPPTARHVALPGGRTLSIRPMNSADAPGIVALYHGLGEEDVYRRFFGGRPPSDRFVATMTGVEARGGIGLVATVPRDDRADDAPTGPTGPTEPTARERIVAEATCEPLTDGDGELGITVAAGARGWLGPFLLDALCDEAAARWIPNLQADVLLTNSPMLATLRRRGTAVIRSETQPAVLRVVVGTVGRVPTWPPASKRPRVVVEVRGGPWSAAEDIRRAGFTVVSCSGPPGGWANCPPMRGEPCPLAADAAVVVNALPSGPKSALLGAHRHVHADVPVCSVGDVPDGELPQGVETVPMGLSGSMMASIVQRLAATS